MGVENLPAYINPDNEEFPYFLSLNRALDGSWSAGYVAYLEEGEITIGSLFLNGAASLTEVGIRMGAKLDRFNRGR